MFPVCERVSYHIEPSEGFLSEDSRGEGIDGGKLTKASKKGISKLFSAPMVNLMLAFRWFKICTKCSAVTLFF